MDAAQAAAMSDPNDNYHFRRRWSEPPPHERERPALVGTSNRAKYSSVSSTQNIPTKSAAFKVSFRLCGGV